MTAKAYHSTQQEGNDVKPSTEHMTLGSRGNHALIGPKISSRLKIGNLGKYSEGLDGSPLNSTLTTSDIACE